MLYSSFSFVLQSIRAEYPGVPVENVPGVSSVLAAAASAESTLTDILAKVRDAKINWQALVMVGEAVNPEPRSPDYVDAKQPASSHLYSESYTFLFRNARFRDADGDSVAPVPASGDSAGN